MSQRGRERIDGPLGFDGRPVSCAYCNSYSFDIVHTRPSRIDRGDYACYFQCRDCEASSPPQPSRGEALAALASISPEYTIHCTEEAEKYDLDGQALMMRSRGIAAMLRDELVAQAGGAADMGWVYDTIRDVLTKNGVCWTTDKERERYGYPPRKVQDWKITEDFIRKKRAASQARIARRQGAYV